jgi:hypothetical protein
VYVTPVTILCYQTVTISSSQHCENQAMAEYPTIIQGGMGAGISGWHLANAVSRMGQLGIVSGTALD